jgi:hypothetical protein
MLCLDVVSCKGLICKLSGFGIKYTSMRKDHPEFLMQAESFVVLAKMLNSNNTQKQVTKMF